MPDLLSRVPCILFRELAPGSNSLNGMVEKKHIKVLVIRFSSIGDIVLCSPVLRCLKQIPGVDCEVHVVTKSQNREVLAHNPHVHKLHLLEGSLRSLLGKLRAEGFHYIIDLHHNLRSAMVKACLRKPSGSFMKLNLEKWLLTRFKIDRLPATHIVERYFDAAAFLGVENDGGGLDFFLSGDADKVPALIPEHFTASYTAFAIGGRHATKRLPNEKIISLCQALPGQVILLGGREDKPNGDVIAQACGHKVFNACGLLSLQQSARLVKDARLVISHDTGLMHIAAAFNKHIISIWGNTVPAFGMEPYMPAFPERSVKIEVEGLPCRPCSKIGFSKCPKKHFDCMKKIDEEKIIRAAKDVLTP